MMGTANISGVGKVSIPNQTTGVNSDVREEDRKINFIDMMNQLSAKPGEELFSQDGDGVKVEELLKENRQLPENTTDITIVRMA